MTILLLMGVAGCGKTTIGAAVAADLGWPFQEGDALHPPANVAKMAGGTPLTDADRWPWLAAIAAVMQGWRAAGSNGVVACSALKRSYRDALRAGHADVRLIYLRGSRALIGDRLAGRRGHFMPPALLDSQFATLEEPTPDEAPFIADIAAPPEMLIAHLSAAFSGRG